MRGPGRESRQQSHYPEGVTVESSRLLDTGFTKKQLVVDARALCKGNPGSNHSPLDGVTVEFLPSPKERKARVRVPCEKTRPVKPRWGGSETIAKAMLEAGSETVVYSR